ncbi:unnamed protein product [Closterium sp. Naga37s-1]|nr:unnamed protein product [Closterium sp. Naga37s-1]
MRRLATLHLLSAKNLQNSLHVREEEICDMLNSIAADASAAYASMSTSDATRMGAATTTTGGTAKSAAESEDGVIVELLGPAAHVCARAQRLALQLHSFMRACIAERRALVRQKKRTEEEETTLVDALFEMEGEGEDKMDKDEILMLAIDMMTAGTYTTSKTVEWALAELAQHPDMLDTLRTKVDAMYARSASAATKTGADRAGWSDVMVSLPVVEMPYLQAVLKETLRHHPVAPFLVPHLTTGSVTLSGYHIPPNTMIQINGWALAHDPTVWINPHEFDPSRLLGPAAPDVTGQNFSLLPFGSGRRGCLGTNLGLDMCARLLANFVLRFDFKLPKDVRAAGGMDMTETFGLTMALAKPLRMVLRERKVVAGAAVAASGA